MKARTLDGTSSLLLLCWRGGRVRPKLAVGLRAGGRHGPVMTDVGSRWAKFGPRYQIWAGLDQVRSTMDWARPKLRRVWPNRPGGAKQAWAAFERTGAGLEQTPRAPITLRSVCVQVGDDQKLTWSPPTERGLRLGRNRAQVCAEIRRILGSGWPSAGLDTLSLGSTAESTEVGGLPEKGHSLTQCESSSSACLRGTVPRWTYDLCFPYPSNLPDPPGVHSHLRPLGTGAAGQAAASCHAEPAAPPRQLPCDRLCRGGHLHCVYVGDAWPQGGRPGRRVLYGSVGAPMVVVTPVIAHTLRQPRPFGKPPRRSPAAGCPVHCGQCCGCRRV